MAKSPPQSFDCLVLGEHPASFLAAALLREQGDLRVLHAALGGLSAPDRLVMVNPTFFELHPLLANLRRKLEMTPVYGLTYLADDAATRAEYRNKASVASVGSYRQIRSEMAAAAEQCGVEFNNAKEIVIHRLDENGVDLKLGKSEIRVRVILVGGGLTDELNKALGFQQAAAKDAIHRYTFARLSRQCVADLGPRQATPICLQLGDPACWAWLFLHGAWGQLCVNQPLESAKSRPPEALLARWVSILRKQGILPAGRELPCEALQAMDLSLAGALEHEGVGNRTLLIGPAGGFYSASTEDIYPNCWSAIYAAQAIQHALKERHLQDALNVFRSSWRTTLGDYLRGPSVNLRYLLPLIYRNPVMTERISESILMGKGVVR